MFVVATGIKQNAQTNLSRHIPVTWDMIFAKPLIHFEKIHTVLTLEDTFRTLGIHQQFYDDGYGVPQHVFQI